MPKKIIYLIVILLAGTFAIFQSCSNESPVVPVNETGNAGTTITVPNEFCGTGILTVRNGYTDEPIGGPIYLWAGAGNPNAAIKVGVVTFDVVNHKAIFNFTDVVEPIGTPDMFPYVATAIHLHIASDYNLIPQTSKHNPIPGQFEYKVDLQPPYNQTQVVIEDIQFEPGVNYIAAHASIVQFGGIEGFNFYLPNDTVQLVVQAQGGNTGAYWKFKINQAGFISTYDSDGPGPLLPGQYLGWCIDIDHTMGQTTYPAQLFSSYETLPQWLVGNGKIEYPENFDKVNYLVNNFNVGQMVQPLNPDCSNINPATSAALTYSDIQVAIWTLIENNTNYSGLGAWDQKRVNAILCNVNANGEGFQPACNQKIVFIVVPNLGSTITYQLIVGQPIIGEVQVPCTTQGQTAWGDGKWGANFTGNNWGTYFKYQTVCTQ